MSERGFFSASNDIKTLDGNIFSGFPWLTTHLLWLTLYYPCVTFDLSNVLHSGSGLAFDGVTSKS